MLHTQSEESVLEFSQQHGAIFVLVVQFQALEEIFVATLFLLLFHLAVDGQEFFEGQQFLAAFLGGANLLDQSKGGVAVQRTEHITQIEGINLVAAIGIVNAETKFSL